MQTIVDWSQYPEPWSRIGPAFAAEARGIATGAVIAHQPPRRPVPDIVARLRDAMESLGMTQRYAAQRLGYSQGTVYRWLGGIDRPNAASTANITTFLAQLKGRARDL